MISAEIVEFPPSAKYRKGAAPDLPAQLFRNLADCGARHHVRVRLTTPERYRGDSDWLMLYGPGGFDRQKLMAKQISRGARVICWDAPYWKRGEKLRVSIDHAHPQRWVMRKRRPDVRLLRDHGFSIVPQFDPGHGQDILLAGIGTKARHQYGADVVREWEQAMVVSARLLWGNDRRILYRPKPNHPTPPPAGAILVRNDVAISQQLFDVSIVVTWHSNVAVDAIWAGKPVACRDGAAAAVYGATLHADMQPISADLRAQFLSNLAWFQWRPDEAPMVWQFLQEMLADDCRGTVQTVSA